MRSALLIRVPHRCSAMLASVAVLGLVVTPLVHAEEHVREAQDDAEVGEAAHEHDLDLGDEDDPGPVEEEHHPHGHSHGAGPHGANSLQHLGVALLAAAAVALPPRQPPPSVRLPPEHLQRHLIPDYLAPDRAQGPPRLGSS